MVFNHQQLNSSFESHGSGSATEQHDYQEIDETNRQRTESEESDSLRTEPPPLPPKPRVLPIKPSNWGQNNNNKENMFKVPQELPRRVLNTNQNEQKKSNDVYLDQPTSSFV